MSRGSDTPDRADGSGSKSPSRFGSLLTRDIDIASLVMFRIAFGTLMFIKVWRFFERGYIPYYWIEPEFNFKYPGFEWLHPWPGVGMYVHFLVLGLLAAFIALGFLYRISAALFFFAYTFVFLLEPARYQNHYYLICLVSFLMVLAPANRCLSLDVKLGFCSPLQRIPRWPVLLLQAQIAIVYIYGGIAKLNADWLRGEPIRLWLEIRGDWPLIGPFLASELAAWIWAYGGILFDLLIVPLLLWKRTRALAFVLVLAFHGLNEVLFDIGIFPVLGICLTTILFSPAWPRRILHPRLFRIGKRQHDRSGTEPPLWHYRRGIAMAVVVPYLLLQVLLPFRHHLIEGDVAWTEEGHNFAWRMKLRGKSGTVEMVAENLDSGEIYKCPIRSWLPGWQRRAVITDPRLLVQLAHHAESRVRELKGWQDIAVRATVKVALNRRPRYLMVHPDLDLTGPLDMMPPKRWVLPAGWIEDSAFDAAGAPRQRTEAAPRGD